MSIASPASDRSRLWRVFSRWASRGAPHLLGSLCGVLLCGWWSCALATFGGGLAMFSGLLLSATIGSAGGLRRWSRGGLSAWATPGGLLMGLAVWTAVGPFLAPLPLALASQLPWEWLSSASMEFLLGAVAGGVWLAVPHAILAALAARRPAQPPAGEEKTQSRSPLASWRPGPRTLSERVRLLLQRLGSTAAAKWQQFRTASAVVPSLGGVAVGLWSAAVWLAPALGLTAILLSATVLVLVWGILMCFQRCELAEASEMVGRSAGSPVGVRSQPPSHFLGIDVLLPLAVGGLLALAGRITNQLWLSGTYCGFAMLSGLLVGVVMGRRCAARWALNRLPASAGACLGSGIVVLAAGVLAGGSELWTDLSLAVNAHVSTGWLVLTLRACACALSACPAGMALGLAGCGPGRREDRPWSSVLMVLTAVGWIVSRWVLPAPGQVFWGVLAMGMGAAVGNWIRAGRPWPVRRWPRWVVGTAVLGSVLAPVGVTQIDVVRSARLLFSARVAAAVSSSADRRLLEALDESRWVGTTMGREAIWTAWKRRGGWLSIRRDGLPFGETALEVGLTPESPAEVMAAAIPLAVHPRADHLLMVGLGGGTALRTSLEFPIRTVTCLEADRDLLAVVREHAGEMLGGCLTDPRATLRCTSPVLASAGRSPRRYDVILLNERQLTGSRVWGSGHVEAYRRWRSHLSDEGLLCVRLEYVDLGAGPVRDAVRTLSAVFSQVLVWESAPGELLILASVSERPLVEEGLLARFSAPHVRRVLARIGWDWSLPLSLVVVQGEGLRALADSGRTVAPTNARFDLGLPLEIARWGAKYQELQAAFRPVATTAVALLPESAARTDLEKRLADVGEQRSLIVRFPDHYWAYRRVLKERLQERPRVDLLQVGLELHPEDERRKEYLKALGAVATQETPAVEEVDRLTSFAAPYDPLVAPFVHGEAARLYARCPERHPERELRERLQAVYFGPGFDRSVRDATAALTLLLDAPKALPDAERRWDHVNALLEILKERWTLRSQQTLPSRYAPADAAEALSVAKRAVAFLEAHAAEAGVDPEWAAARSRALDRTLIRALRTYQAEQTAKLKRLEREQAARHASNVLP